MKEQLLPSAAGAENEKNVNYAKTRICTKCTQKTRTKRSIGVRIVSMPVTGIFNKAVENWHEVAKIIRR